MCSFFVAAFLSAVAVQAAPALSAGQSPATVLTTQQIETFLPYTHYASAAYCTPAQTLAWNCGASCQANPDFKPADSGGNGDSVGNCEGFVGYDPNLRTVVLSRQGSTTLEIGPLLSDADTILSNLDPTLFPGLPSDIKAHRDFAAKQASTAPDVLAAVQKAMSEYPGSPVAVVGHSLGAALALLDGVYLPLHLPPGTSFQTVTYGLPRVGNQAFANYVDKNVHLTHINNKEDPIPVLPCTSLGFVQPSGELHILDSGEWVSCSGQDSTSPQCIVGDVSKAQNGILTDHVGPYAGITMGC